MLSWTASILSAVCLAGALAPAIVMAEPASGPAADASPEGADLQLEVTLNGAATGLIGAFRRTDDGALFGTGDDLRAMGLNVAAGPAWLRLDSLKGVRADYDATAQTLAITAAPSAVLTHVISVRAPQEAMAKPRSDLGALLNYSLFISDAAETRSGRWSPPSGGGELEARAFGGFGLVSSLFDIEAGGAQTRATRLDSAWTYSDPVRLIDYAAGDVITGGFDWTRPVRLGGLQMRRDFGLAPGLITLPAPSLSATAAVPSVAQVMVNGATVLSQSVQSGPLQVQGLPALQGPSTAQLVLRDQSGRQIATYGGGFYATPQMLAPGLMDFSSEMGFARRYFGLRSQDYDNDLVGSVSVRYGLTDASTVQVHAEGGAGLALAGAGLVQRVGGVGAVEMSVAASGYGGKTGVQLGLGGQSQVGLVTAGVQVLATQGRYADLGAVTAAGGWRRIDQLGVLPPERLVQADLSVPLKGLRLWGQDCPTAMIGVSDIQDAVSGDHKVISLSLRQPLFRGASLYIQAYSTPQSRGGVFLALSIPLGGGRGLVSGAQAGDGPSSAYAEVSSPGSPEPGSFAWRAQAEAGPQAGVEAEGDYRAAQGDIDVLVRDAGGVASIQARADGALVLMDKAVFAAPAIHQAFAVVEAGLPNVPILFENRPIGKSGAGGLFLAPDLAADAANHISIDPDRLPADATVDSLRVVATPSVGSGMIVRFPVRQHPRGALLTLADAGGQLLPVASRGRAGPKALPFEVGYDGQAYVEDAAVGEVLDLTLPEGRACRAIIQQVNDEFQATACR